MSPSLRLLPFETLTGPATMAADEVLLESAVAGVASLRFYAWSEPTLSLGYFQPAAERLLDPALAELAWVRRATGGSALVHHHEVTYALALPPGLPWQSKVRPWSCRFHDVIADALKQLGARTSQVVCGDERKLGPMLCFLDQTPGDLLASGAKVVGSAQRKQKGALLQHGGILLKQSPFTPTLPGLHERTGVEITGEEVARRVEAAFAEGTGWELVPGQWSSAELDRRLAIKKDRYGNAEWNERR